MFFNEVRDNFCRRYRISWGKSNCRRAVNIRFHTFDTDFVDPASPPGTGTPEVGGFTSWEVLSLVRALKNLHYVGFDIVEVMPGIDQAELTAYLAANIGFEFLSILAFQKKNGLR